MNILFIFKVHVKYASFSAGVILRYSPHGAFTDCALMLLILVCISASAFACACCVFLCGGFVMYPNRYLGNIVKAVVWLKYSLAESLYFLAKLPTFVYGINLTFCTVLGFFGGLSGSFCFLSTCGCCATACNSFILSK